MRLKSRHSPVPIKLGDAGIAAFISRHAPDWSMPWRSEPWHKFILVLAGNAGIEREGTIVPLHEDMLLLVPAGLRHRMVDPPGSTAVIAGICVGQTRLESACGPGWPRLEQTLATGFPIVQPTRESIIRLIGAILNRTRESGYTDSLALWGKLLGVLAEIEARTAKEQSTPDFNNGLDETLSWLDDHCIQPISILELASRARLSYRAFTAQVRRKTGESVLQRILRLRLERAGHLMRTEMPITEVALACGFGDLSGFYRQFRKKFKRSPKVYRNEIKA
jgi:AraC-like DNA-binding protein